MTAKATLIAILAAGRSSRFGGTKALANCGGKSLLKRAIDCAKSTKGDVVVITGWDSKNVTIHANDVECIHNPEWETGLSSSIVHAVNHAKELDAVGLLIMLVDQPAMSSDHLQRLIDANTDCIGTKYPDGSVGVPAYFSRDLFTTLSELTGDHGAKDVLAVQGSAYITFHDLRDIDTPADLEHYLNERTT